ncbi:substrate-binding domain-containing protein [Roseobacter sinensis]|uniref:Substrate-binding domain-containing protein n=1 Tax=Roseobacter sinensis TaxID=2931391 RepID=A0ABT3BKI8_9RHOB|nr:substrate-binding domain-containing protein [Roseobacter sp. WL0113]MCV3274080.1 substrate-binding domain-containing protein [Roseobacter sp. WL0113]
MPLKARRKTTIYNIAQKARSSPSAVSSALNGTWKKRRLKEETVERILRIAREEGYTANLQARGLRKAKSGLAGLILPNHENRFFAELSETFALESQARGHCPAIVHAGRDVEVQLQALRDLLSYAVDFVFIAGATDPDGLARLCRDAHLPHVFVDQPCAQAPSVVADNRAAAAALTETLLEDMAPSDPDDPGSWLYLLGGEETSSATVERVRGFRAQMQASGFLYSEDQIIACGYDPVRATDALGRLHRDLGRLPGGLFVNSIDCFEGVVRYLAQVPEAETKRTQFGCFDHDPLATLLRVPLRMVRQRSDVMIAEAFRQLDAGAQGGSLLQVPCELL